MVVLIDGAIVEERIVRRRTPVHLGRGARCDLLAPSPDAPLRWPLFTVRRGRWLVQPAPGMQARLAAGDAPPVALSGPTPLPEDARGKLLLGEVTVLFQLIAAPAPPVRPPLPRGLRLRLRDRVDPYMAAVVIFSVLAHVGALGYIGSRDTPLRPEPPEVAGLFERHPMARLPPPVHLQPAGTPSPDPSPVPAPAPAPAPALGAPRPSPHSEPASPQDVGGVLDLLGHAGKGPGRFDDVTGKKNPGGDLLAGVDKAAHQGGLALADGNRPRGPSDLPTIGNGRDPNVTGPHDVLDAARPPRVGEDDPRPHIDLPRPPAEPGADRSADDVYTKIRQTYFGRVQKCYEDVLKRDSALRGRVDVTITIGDRGQVVAVSASGFDPALDTCIEADARRWRFDAHAGAAPTTFEFPFSFSSSSR